MILLLALLCVLVTALLAGALYQQVGLWHDRRSHPPLGQLIAIAETERKPTLLHLLQHGAGEPAVIFESGIAGSLLGWSLVQNRVGEFTNVISYDRAGLGWSTRSKQPRTVENMIAELHSLLDAASIRGPVILVGHSFGGLLIRAYAHRWPKQVAGLVLVDPVGHSSWARAPHAERSRLKMGVVLSRRGAMLADLGVVRGALTLLTSGRRWLPQQVSKATAGRGASVLERLVGQVRQLPEWSHPKIRAHWSDGRCFRAMADYLEALPECASYAVDLSVPAHIPVTVLSANSATEPERAERDAWVAASRRGTHIQVPDSGHWIQIQRPDVVIEAVREMVGWARAGLLLQDS